MHLELQAVCRQLADDFETRVVILTGEGGVFSSGADTSEWRDSASNNELEVRNTSGLGSRTSAAIENLDQITIAAVAGLRDRRRGRSDGLLRPAGRRRIRLVLDTGGPAWPPARLERPPAPRPRDGPRPRARADGHLRALQRREGVRIRPRHAPRARRRSRDEGPRARASESSPTRRCPSPSPKRR